VLVVEVDEQLVKVVVGVETDDNFLQVFFPFKIQKAGFLFSILLIYLGKIKKNICQ